jgi:hypothetical protein
MSVTRFFEQLGAPLANPQWSWGAQRPSDGAVFMRVWQDEKLVEDGRLYFLVLGDSDRFSSSPRLGYRERLRHIEAVRAGAPCFLVMLIAADASASKRRVADFDCESVFVGGALVQKDGRLWIEVKGRHRIADVAVGSWT